MHKICCVVVLYAHIMLCCTICVIIFYQKVCEMVVCATNAVIVFCAMNTVSQYFVNKIPCKVISFITCVIYLCSQPAIIICYRFNEIWEEMRVTGEFIMYKNEKQAFEVILYMHIKFCMHVLFDQNKQLTCVCKFKLLKQ